jgi:UDP-N-acetylglucosamine--N-acetylmuramyl-(pentapeptide) pyrophosphoryl-undecaprenol N-acetylglucosamine transferase
MGTTYLKREPRALFVGGGSAGHAAPLLAVMKEMHSLRPDICLHYCGTEADLSSPLVSESAIPFERHAIEAGKIHRFMTLQHISEAKKIVKGLWQAQVLMEKLQPDVVFAKGGFVTVPLALAAALRAIPIYAHETDVVPGLATRLVGLFAEKVFTAFPAQYYHALPQEKLIYSGQPVREEFYGASERGEILVSGKKVSLDKPLVTIIGGSLGAHRINELISKGWEELLKIAQVVHICGKQDYGVLQRLAESLPSELSDKLVLSPFINHELPILFSSSCVVVSRAGGTIAELAAARAATILIPLSTAAQNHQWANAKVFSKAGAAMVVDERLIDSEKLAQMIIGLCLDSTERSRYAGAISLFAKPDAAYRMAACLASSFLP